MRLIYLPQLWKYSKKYYYISCKQFHNVTILTLPKGLNLWLRGHDFQNLERGFMDIISFLCIQNISHYCESKADFLWFNTFSVYCDIWRYWSRPNDWTFDKGAMKKKNWKRASWNIFTTFVGVEDKILKHFYCICGSGHEATGWGEFSFFFYNIDYLQFISSTRPKSTVITICLVVFKNLKM